jgi:hypothetical protein
MHRLTDRSLGPDLGGRGYHHFAVIARVDSPVEIRYYKNGGILQTTLRRLLGTARAPAVWAAAEAVRHGGLVCAGDTLDAWMSFSA